MKKRAGLLSLCLVLALVISTFVSVTEVKAASAKNTLDIYRKYSISKSKEFKKTITTGTNTINYSISYPVITIEGDKKATTAANKVIKKYATSTIAKKYSGSYYDYDGNDMINASYVFETVLPGRYGNIISLFCLGCVEVENSPYPINENVILNIDLTTGKQVKIADLFTSSKKFTKAVGSYVYDYFKNAAEPVFDEYVTKADVIAAITSQSIGFSDTGISVWLDESDGLTPHAVGMLFCAVDADTYAKYIKKSAEGLFAPASSYELILPYSAGTGYSWTVELVSGDCIEIADQHSYSDYDINLPLAGGPMKYVTVINPLKAGTAVIKAVFARPWSQEDATVKEIKIKVSKSLKMTVSE